LWDISDPTAPVEVGVPGLTAGRSYFPIWSRDDALVATSGSGGTVVFGVDADGAHQLTTIAGHADGGLAFSPSEGSLLALKPLLFGPAQLVDVRTGVSRDLSLDGVGLNCCDGVTFSPDGGRVAIAAGTAGVAIFDVATATPVVTLPFPSQVVYELRFSPDGTRLVAADSAGAIVMWDTRTWTELERFKTGLGVVNDVRFVDGDRLLVFGHDGMATMISTTSGVFLATSEGVARVDLASHAFTVEHGSPAVAVGIGPDESSITVGRADGRVEVLDAKTLAVRSALGSVNRSCRVGWLSVPTARG
jgi:WD40 repeat protein